LERFIETEECSQFLEILSDYDPTEQKVIDALNDLHHVTITSLSPSPGCSSYEQVRQEVLLRAAGLVDFIVSNKGLSVTDRGLPIGTRLLDCIFTEWKETGGPSQVQSEITRWVRFLGILGVLGGRSPTSLLKTDSSAIEEALLRAGLGVYSYYRYIHPEAKYDRFITDRQVFVPYVGFVEWLTDFLGGEETLKQRWERALEWDAEWDAYFGSGVGIGDFFTEELFIRIGPEHLRTVEFWKYLTPNTEEKIKSCWRKDKPAIVKNKEGLQQALRNHFLALIDRELRGLAEPQPENGGTAGECIDVLTHDEGLAEPQPENGGTAEVGFHPQNIPEGSKVYFLQSDGITGPDCIGLFLAGWHPQDKTVVIVYPVEKIRGRGEGEGQTKYLKKEDDDYLLYLNGLEITDKRLELKMVMSDGLGSALKNGKVNHLFIPLTDRADKWVIDHFKTIPAVVCVYSEKPVLFDKDPNDCVLVAYAGQPWNAQGQYSPTTRDIFVFGRLTQEASDWLKRKVKEVPEDLTAISGLHALSKDGLKTWSVERTEALKPTPIPQRESGAIIAT
jgi:hypothetical protein